MATEAITLTSPVEAVIDGRHIDRTKQRPIRVEQFLHRFGSHATLMIVESLKAEDGTLRRQVRFASWPGL